MKRLAYSNKVNNLALGVGAKQNNIKYTLKLGKNNLNVKEPLIGFAFKSCNNNYKYLNRQNSNLKTSFFL